ncbi:bacillithiol system redox-active protein YtxJ [Maribacter sp. MJ134]|uniref:bacillithiol system redox-active protein YtxJ n=1 Tax=Maribacter sp. MJ134 TaxID=2496865 RepID=UPI000F83938D|nr:bacillithiol system redox-active protein YtxJ [Maribacter sp. MJ134]AZQ58006.1 bacillithiol system redox-active protein YtxJ [Maribacter sp. MJ134]
MGLFGGIFGKGDGEGKKSKPEIPWIALTSIEQLDEIVAKSSGKPQFIFKHSTTCGISRMVLNMFTSGYSLESNQADFYFLDLHAHREVSNGVAQKFQVMHQSPQLLVVKNGVVVAHSSHGAISEIALEQYI